MNVITELNRRLYEISYRDIDENLLAIEDEIKRLRTYYNNNSLKASDYARIEKQILKLRKVYKETQKEFDKLDVKFEKFC